MTFEKFLMEEGIVGVRSVEWQNDSHHEKFYYGWHFEWTWIRVNMPVEEYYYSAHIIFFIAQFSKRNWIDKVLTFSPFNGIFHVCEKEGSGACILKVVLKHSIDITRMIKQ